MDFCCWIGLQEHLISFSFLQARARMSLPRLALELSVLNLPCSFDSRPAHRNLAGSTDHGDSDELKVVRWTLVVTGRSRERQESKKDLGSFSILNDTHHITELLLQLAV